MKLQRLHLGRWSRVRNPWTQWLSGKMTLDAEGYIQSCTVQLFLHWSCQADQEVTESKYYKAELGIDTLRRTLRVTTSCVGCAKRFWRQCGGAGLGAVASIKEDQPKSQGPLPHMFTRSMSQDDLHRSRQHRFAAMTGEDWLFRPQLQRLRHGHSSKFEAFHATAVPPLARHLPKV